MQNLKGNNKKEQILSHWETSNNLVLSIQIHWHYFQENNRISVRLQDLLGSTGLMAAF